MSTPNPTHIIAEHHGAFDDYRLMFVCRCGETWPALSDDYDTEIELHAEHVVSELTDAGYSIVGPVSETYDDSDGSKRDSQTGDEINEPKVCEGFAWVGQSFACCDECGRPYWEHSHDRRSGGSDGPFGLGMRLVPITPEQAHGCRMKWDPSFTAAAAEGEKL